MGMHEVNALIKRLEELKQEYCETPEKLTHRVILEALLYVVKDYTFDRRDLLHLFYGQGLSFEDFKAIKELDYND